MEIINKYTNLKWDWNEISKSPYITTKDIENN